MARGPEPRASGSAAAHASALVAATRDDPAGRLELVEQTYRGPYGHAPRHLPFRRAALSFMRWQVGRGLLEPLTAQPAGSPWWRAVNERLLRDQCEALARSGGLAGAPSATTIRPWMAFIRHGVPIYAWLYQERWDWRPPPPSRPARMLRYATSS